MTSTGTTISATSTASPQAQPTVAAFARPASPLLPPECRDMTPKTLALLAVTLTLLARQRAARI